MTTIARGPIALILARVAGLVRLARVAGLAAIARVAGLAAIARVAGLAAIARVAGLVAIAALIAGCDAKPQSPGADDAPPVLRLGYFPNLTHAQAVLGVANGEFATAIAPTKLETKTFNAGPSLIEALFAGEIDVAYVGPGPALNAHARSHGQAVRIVAGAAANGVVIVAAKDSSIRTLDDLRGKRVATPQLGNTQDISARHFLREKLGADAVTIVPVANAEQAAMMDRGQIDAAWAPEPWGSRLMVERGARLIADESDLWPDKQFTLTVVITTPEFLAKHPGTLRKLLGAHHALTVKLAADPQSQVKALADALEKLNGKPLPAGVLENAIARVVFTDRPIESSLSAFARWSYDLGYAREPISTTGLVDSRLIDAVVGRDAGASNQAPHDAPASPHAVNGRTFRPLSRGRLGPVWRDSRQNRGLEVVKTAPRAPKSPFLDGENAERRGRGGPATVESAFASTSRRHPLVTLTALPAAPADAAKGSGDAH